MNQAKKSESFPEYFLYWTFSHPELLKTPLTTTRNEPLEIIVPGEQNHDSGPDYLDAELKIDGLRLRGDIEFHLCWQDWFQHGHQDDRRYRQVILHVLWLPANDLPASLEKRFSHLILSGQLQVSRSQWLEAMKSLQADMPNTLPALPADGPTIPQLETLAWQRFLRKCNQLKYWLNRFGWETTVYLGLAKVLGYSKNSQPFVSLIRQFYPEQLLQIVHPLQRSPVLFWVLLTYQAGLLDRPFRTEPRQNSPAFQTVKRIYESYRPQLPFQKTEILHWRFSALRPQNNPYYRLAGFSQILFHYQNRPLFQQLITIFSKRLPLKQLLSETKQALIFDLSKEFSPLLSGLLGFRQIPARTMGSGRFRLFVLNILLPLFYLYAEQLRSPGFQCYLEDLFYCFPPADNNALLSRMEQQLNPKLPRKAFVQQALLEIAVNQDVRFPKNELPR